MKVEAFCWLCLMSDAAVVCVLGWIFSLVSRNFRVLGEVGR